MRLVDPDHDPTVMPSADDPSLSLEESVELLCENIDQLCAQREQIRRTLSAFYMAPISAATLQPLLDLCEQLDPTLRSQRLAQRIEDTVLSLVPRDEDDIITPDTGHPF